MRSRCSMFMSMMTAFVLAACLVVAPARAGAESGKQLVRRFTDEVYNQRSKPSIAKYVHPDFVDHSPGAGPDAHGLAYVEAQWDRNYAAFPDLRFTIDDVLAERDKVVMRWTSDGTFSGTLANVTGKGQPVTVSGVSIFRIQDGKIIESWDFVDRMAMLLQAGFKVSPPEGK